MPLVSSTYSPPWLFKNGHFSTIYSAKLRPNPILEQERERFSLEDGDFLDIDWSISKPKNTKLALVLHGLEGNAQRTYIKGIGKLLVENGWDIAAVNFRGCSGSMNLVYPSYHSGKTDDLDFVIASIIEKDQYQDISLIGFSLGANMLLKYLGERNQVPAPIKRGVAISVPVSLRGSLDSLMNLENWLYSTNFLMHLKKKYREKMVQFPNKMNESDLKAIKTLKDFDDIYTSKAHGFKDAYDYYEKCSSLQFLPAIQLPVLLLNAKNDSFLNTDCYPIDLAMKSKNVYLEMPEYGGHVGFHQSNKEYYSERRTLQFLLDYL